MSSQGDNDLVTDGLPVSYLGGATERDPTIGDFSYAEAFARTPRGRVENICPPP